MPGRNINETVTENVAFLCYQFSSCSFNYGIFSFYLSMKLLNERLWSPTSIEGRSSQWKMTLREVSNSEGMPLKKTKQKQKHALPSSFQSHYLEWNVTSRIWATFIDSQMEDSRCMWQRNTVERFWVSNNRKASVPLWTNPWNFLQERNKCLLFKFLLNTMSHSRAISPAGWRLTISRRTAKTLKCGIWACHPSLYQIFLFLKHLGVM